jgi:hypothetical protein
VSARRLAGAASLAAVGLLCGPALRRMMLEWGATAQEAARALPGDELLPDPDLVATRAITIAAPPAAVWPWLVQIGIGRAGAYSYDWLDRLFGLDVRSTRRIVPELQDLCVGDVIPVANDGTGLRVRLIERERVLGASTDDGTWAWTWVLELGHDAAGFSAARGWPPPRRRSLRASRPRSSWCPRPGSWSAECCWACANEPRPSTEGSRRWGRRPCLLRQDPAVIGDDEVRPGEPGPVSGRRRTRRVPCGRR